MKISPNFHLAYSTNVHPAESWEATFNAIKTYTARVGREIAGLRPFGIGLRLSARAARELSEHSALLEFRRWLDRNNCYVFTINGFPYGDFHNVVVKERVFLPDWSSGERLEYTKLLFNILAELLPPDCEGSVSTLPVSFKGFEPSVEQINFAKSNFYNCVEHIERLSEAKGVLMHLGLEPEPLGFVETAEEFINFFNELKEGYRNSERIHRHLGINYDCCHLAVEFEDARIGLGRLADAGVKISKIHLSNAISVSPDEKALEILKMYNEQTYLHQTVIKTKNGSLIRFKDLNYAIELARKNPALESEEWRIHFHIPLYAKPEPPLNNTVAHIKSVLDELKLRPGLCSHFEIETYTFGVLPETMKNRNIIDHLADEYRFAINEFNRAGFVS